MLLFAGAPPREGDVFPSAVAEELTVQELTAVVGVDSNQGKGQQLPSVIQGSNHPLLAAVQQRQTFRPTGGDIGERQGLQECTLGAPTAMRHQIDLHAARPGVVPILEGAHRNLPLEQRPRLGRRQPVRLVALPVRPQQTVRRGGADGQQLRPFFRTERQVAVALEGWDQLRQKRRQTLGADAVRRRPADGQRRLDDWSVPPCPSSPDRLPRRHGMGKQSDRVLAGVARRRCKLIQNGRLLCWPRFPVATRHLRQQFPFAPNTPGRPHSYLRSLRSLASGDIIREAVRGVTRWRDS